MKIRTSSKYCNIKYLVTIVGISVFLNSCGGNSSKETADHDKELDNRSIEQIHKEEGVPVRVMSVDNVTLSNEMTFLATMSGIQETTVNSTIADKIIKISVKVGSHVSAGQVLMNFPTDNPQLQWEQAKTAYENAKKTWERMKNLLVAGEISQANYDATETQYFVAKQNFESLLKRVNVEAPFSGVVTNIPVKIGDQVNNNAPLITIAQTGTMIARIWATESEIRFLKVGLKAEITIDGKVYTGKIASISMGMDPTKRAFQVDVHFNNSKREIKSGVTTTLTVKLDNVSSKSILLPRRIVMINADEQFIFVAKDGIANKVLIKTGKIIGVSIEVVEGLNSSDEIIVEGNSLLSNGAKIRVMK